MKTMRGNLLTPALEGHFDVIIHGCNCNGAIGAGIVQEISLTFPEACESDKKTTVGDCSKLGTISSACVLRNGRQLIVVNGYTQFNTSGPVCE
jgi:O-acetyl-ADP-ribose deacetylase (regulator of RNase III)